MNDLLFAPADIVLRVIGDDMNRINNSMPLRDELDAAIKAARERQRSSGCICLPPDASFAAGSCPTCGGALRHTPASPDEYPDAKRGSAL